MADGARDLINFDYSTPEWAAIEHVIAKARSDALSDIERDALRITAADYLRDQREWKTGQAAPVKRRAQRKAWKNVASKVAELKRFVDEVAVLNSHPDMLIFVTQEMLAAVEGRPAPKPKTERFFLKGREHAVTLPLTAPVDGPARWMSADQLCAFLSQIEFAADRSAAHMSSGAAYCWTISGRLEPRVTYMQQILWLWTHRFGGKLTLSVDSTHIKARVSGPLVDYVAAVAGPVMKAGCPKPSSLRDTIKRQKKFYAWLSKHEAEHGEVGPWAYNRAIAMRGRRPYGEVGSAA
jgi:hypothetical protein